MSPDVFLKFKEDLLATIESDQKFWTIKDQVGRLLSHVESEQRVSMSHGRDIDELKVAVFDTNTSIGLRTWRRDVEGLLQEIKWFVRIIAASLVTLLVAEAWTKIHGDATEHAPGKPSIENVIHQ